MVPCRYLALVAAVVATGVAQARTGRYDALGYPDENGNFVLTEEGRNLWGQDPLMINFISFFYSYL